MANSNISALRPTATNRQVIARSTVTPDAGRSLVLRGGSTFDNVTIPGITPALPFSAALWFKIQQTGGNYLRFISYRSTTAGQMGGFELQTNAATTRLFLAGYNSAGTSLFSLSPANTFAYNTWHHVAITMAANSNIIYLDGVAIGSNTTQTIAMPTGQVLTLGKSSFTSGSPFVGQIDQFVFANATWTAGEVSNLHSQGTVPDTATCVLNFDERSGSVCKDDSGDGHPGVYTGNLTVHGRVSDVPPHQPTYPRTTLL